MKKYILVIKSYKNYLQTDKPIFGALIIGLVISYISLLYLYGYYSSVKHGKEIYDFTTKKYTIKIDTTVTYEERISFLDSLRKDASFPSLEVLRVLGKAKIKENNTDIVIGAYQPRNMHLYLFQGKYFSPENLTNADRVAIVDKGIYYTDIYKQDPSVIGRKVSIGGDEFRIIGVDGMLEKNMVEVPYSTFMSKKYNIDSLEVVFQKPLNSLQGSKLEGLVNKLLDKSVIIKPPDVNSQILITFILQMVLVILIISFAIINLIYLFKYLVEKREREFLIYRICGAKRINIFSMLMIENFLLNLVTYFLSLIIFIPLYFLAFKRLNIDVSLNLTDCLLVYAIICMISFLAISRTLIKLTLTKLVRCEATL